MVLIPGEWDIQPLHQPNEYDALDMYRIYTEAIHSVDDHFYTSLQKDAWLRAVNRDFFITMVMVEQYDVWLARAQQGTAIGFAALQEDEITYLYVKPQATGKGVGSALLSLAEHEASARGFNLLSLRASMNAKSFYEHRGYDIVQYAVLEKYGLELPCYVMEKML